MRSVSSLEVCCGQRRQSARDTNSLQPLVNPFTPGMTNTEFLLTMSIQYQGDR